MEEWRVIPNFPNYAVSNLGNFKRIRDGKGTKAGKDRKTYINPVTGYRNVTFGGHSDGNPNHKLVTRTQSAHRIVAEVWIPNPDNLPTVDHINGNRGDNRVENLRWSSYRDNTGEHGKPVQAVNEDGTEGLQFPKIKDAAAHFGISPGTIKLWVRDGRVHKGYVFKFLDKSDR
jgi:hypothetical protein